MFAFNRVGILLFCLGIVPHVRIPFFLYGLLIVGDAIAEDGIRVATSKFYGNQREQHVNRSHIVEGILGTAFLGSIKKLLRGDVGGGNHIGNRPQQTVFFHIALEG